MTAMWNHHCPAEKTEMIQKMQELLARRKALADAADKARADQVAKAQT